MAVRRLTEGDGVALTEDTVQQRLRVDLRRNVVAFLADLGDRSRVDRGAGVMGFNAGLNYPTGSIGSQLRAILTGIGAGQPWADVASLVAALAGALGESVLTTDLLARIALIDAGTAVVGSVSARIAAEAALRAAALAQEAANRATAIAIAVGNEALARANAIQAEAVARGVAVSQEADDRRNGLAALAAVKNRTFYSSTTPTSDAAYTLQANDTWVDTGNDNRISRWMGSAWVPADDARIGRAVADINTERTQRANADTAEAAVRESLYAALNGTLGSDYKVFNQPLQPVGTVIGDVWTWKTAAGVETFSRWNGSAWVDSLADKRAAVYRGEYADQAALPITGNVIGDLARRASDNLVRVWAGTSWVAKTAAAAPVWAFIEQERAARVTADSAEASARTSLATQMRGGYGGTDIGSLSSGLLFDERTARSTADATEVTARQSLSATLTGLADPSGASLATLSAGLLFEERTARASGDAAEVTARQTLSARLTGLADPTGATLQSLASGLLYEERQARVTGDSATASMITTLQSSLTDGMTAPFTALLGWNFNGALEGWVGYPGFSGSLAAGTYAATARTDSAGYLILLRNLAAAEQFSGAAADKVRARFRRSGLAVWTGSLLYGTLNHGESAGFYKSVAEPMWDASGWGVAEWDMSALTAGGSDWVSSTITYLRLDLSQQPSPAGVGYDIDWISIGSRAGTNLAAVVQQEISTRVSEGAAESNARTTLAAQLRGPYAGSDINALSAGLLYDERQARVTADSANASQITTLRSALSDGAAAPFTALLGWNFNGSLEGWIGYPGFSGSLTASNYTADARTSGAGDLLLLRTLSAAERFSGAAADKVRARLRKAGTPIWGGSLVYVTLDGHGESGAYYKGVPEPAWDADGWGLVEWDMSALSAGGTDWVTSTITALRLDLSRSPGPAGAGYLIDWISVGSRGGSSLAAVVQQEISTRVSEGAAEANARTTLATQLRGGYGGTDINALSAGLLYDERQARTTADASEVSARQVLSAKMTGVADPASATLATLSSGLLYDERQARVTSDTAQVGRLQTLEATVNNASTGVVATASSLDAVKLIVNNGASGNAALATRTQTLEASVTSPNAGNNPTYAAVINESIARANADGSLQAQWVLKVAATRADGRKVFAAIGAAATAEGDAGESQILIQADRLVFVPSSNINANPVNMLQVGAVNGVTTLIVPAARIGDSTITPGKITTPNLSALSADLGAVTAGTITLNSSGYIRMGQTDYDTGIGGFFGRSGGDTKLSLRTNSGKYLRFSAAGGLEYSGDIVFAAFSASIAGGDINVSKPNGEATYGARTLTVVGGKAPVTYLWFIATQAADNNTYPWNVSLVSDVTAPSISVVGTATDNAVNALVVCLLTDGDNRSSKSTFSVYATHGTVAHA